MEAAHKHVLVATFIAIAGAVMARREEDEEARMIVWTQVAILLATFCYYTRVWEPLLATVPAPPPAGDPAAAAADGAPPPPGRAPGTAWRIGVGELLVAGTREPLLRALLRGSYGP